MGQVPPLVLLAGLASGQSKSQLRKSPHGIFLSPDKAELQTQPQKKSRPGLPRAAWVPCQACEILPEIKACTHCATQARSVTCGRLDQRGHERGDGGQGHPAPGRGLVLQGHAGDERAQGVTHIRGM